MSTEQTSEAVVLSVSLKAGCYRHIIFPLDEKLSSVADEILYGFDFTNDHVYAFFMDNIAFSPADNYYVDFLAEMDGYRSTSDFSLRDLNLTKGKAFKFVFDFGDDWRFQCKVLRLIDDHDGSIELLKEVGDAPSQYDGWDDEY